MPEKRAAISPDTYVGFINVLFAVVIGQSFAMMDWGKTLASCFEDPTKYAETIVMLFLVYTLVITSWIFYHESTSRSEIRSNWRFVTDLMLVFLYYLGFRYVTEYNAVMKIFMLVFILYFVWDCIRIGEYRKKKEPRVAFAWRTVCTLAFTITSAFLPWIFGIVDQFIPGVGWLWHAIILFGFLILYRVVKIWARNKWQVIPDPPPANVQAQVGGAPPP